MYQTLPMSIESGIRRSRKQNKEAFFGYAAESEFTIFMI
jgi:hypothetical protein